MTKLAWDKVGDRFFETGIDHGVLYLSDGTGVPWSGLTGLDEDFGGDSTDPKYLDGVKYLDEPSFGDYSATLKAFTYPDEFLEYEGAADLGNGLSVDDQAAKPFGLSYRTLVGNDIDGSSHAFKIHILYNLTATPDALTHETLNDSPTPADFSWRLSSIPQDAKGYRPTAHVIFDTRFIWKDLLQSLEGMLYGSDTNDAYLPSINDLIDFAAAWGPQIITPDTVGGLATLSDGMGDLTPSTTTGIYVAISSGRLVETATPGLYQLS